MSGSYGVLNQKYNTLLSQVLTSSSGDGSYVNYPTAQGDITLQGVTINNKLSIGTEGIDSIVSNAIIPIGTINAGNIQLSKTGKTTQILGNSSVAGTSSFTGTMTSANINSSGTVSATALKCSTIDSASGLSVGTLSSTTSLVIGKTSYSSIINSSTSTPCKVNFLDTTASIPLNIGATSATNINLGRTGQLVNCLGSVAVAQGINMNQTAITNLTSIGNGSASLDITAPNGLSLNSTVGTVGQYLGSNAIGQPTWKSLSIPTLNQVLTSGNTTSQSAIFGTGSTSNVVSNSGIILSDNSLSLIETDIIANKISINDLNTSKSIVLDNSLVGLSPILSLNDSVNGLYSSLSNTDLFFRFNSFPFSTVGISKVGTGLNLKTNGTLTLQDLTGTSGQYLKLNSSGNAVWDVVSSATTATNANNVAITNTASSSAYYPTLVASSATGNQAELVSSSLSFVPSTGILSATTFNGNLTGNATSATTATNATNVAITNTVSSSAVYPTLVSSSATGNQAELVSSGLSFVPSTGVLSATTFEGGLTMGTGKNITLQPTADYVAPTADTMLGGITTGTFLTPASSFSTNKDIATISLVKGTYLVFYVFNANYSSMPSRQYISLTGTALPAPTGNFGSGVITTAINSFNNSFPISVTTAGTVILTFNITGTITSITASSYRAVRIA
jgi:hypothetical protein